ncbi:MAG: T6SS immunity protein Tli3 family protein, partial [Kluyvera intermedia]
MKKKTKIILWTVSTLVLLAAIGYGVLVWLAIAATGGWGYGIPSGSTGKVDNRVIRTNAPPQVIYRVDKDRFLTLENYISCDKGGT